MKPEDIYELFGFYDPKWCIEVEREPYGYHSVRCIHPKPMHIQLDPNAEITPSTPYHETSVTLEAYSNGTKRIGFAGRCKVCGKVYHVR